MEFSCNSRGSLRSVTGPSGYDAQGSACHLISLGSISLGSISLGSDRFISLSLWGQTDLEFSPLTSLWGPSLWGQTGPSLWGPSLWGQTDLEFSLSLGSDRFRIFSAQATSLWGQTHISLGSISLGSDRFSLWGQTDLEFSPLRPRARSSARRSRLAFDSLWSRAANRADRLGTLSGRERPRIGTSSARVASVWCFAR